MTEADDFLVAASGRKSLVRQQHPDLRCTEKACAQPRLILFTTIVIELPQLRALANVRHMRDVRKDAIHGQSAECYFLGFFVNFPDGPSSLIGENSAFSTAAHSARGESVLFSAGVMYAMPVFRFALTLETPFTV